VSLATSVARIASILEAVAGVFNVNVGPLITRDRLEAEGEQFIGQHLRSWVIQYVIQVGHLGVQASAHTELDVTVIARHEVQEGREQETYTEFSALLEEAAQALIVEGSGMPAIDEAGVTIDFTSEPQITDTGHLCWEAQLRFHLLDVTSS